MMARAITPGATRIGWIGTGVMGTSMCGHLVAAGYPSTDLAPRPAQSARAVRRRAVAPEVVESLRQLLEVMGKTIVHQGPAGSGQHTKMVNQVLIASGMIGVCEGLLYGYKAGLDLNTVLQSVGSGAAGSWSLNNLGPRMIAGNFEPGFFVEHFLKDMLN